MLSYVYTGPDRTGLASVYMEPFETDQDPFGSVQDWFQTGPV